MKKILIIIIAVGLLFSYGCSGAKTGEEFGLDIKYDISTSVNIVEASTLSESDMLEIVDFIAKVKVVEADYVVSDVHKKSGGGEEVHSALVVTIEEEYFENSELYNNGDKMRIISDQTISNFVKSGINMQVGKEYIVFIDLYSENLLSSIQNFTASIIIDPTIAVIPCEGNEYIVNNSLTELIALATETKAVDITINDSYSEADYTSAEILPLSNVVSNLTVIVEDDISSLIAAYIAK